MRSTSLRSSGSGCGKLVTPPRSTTSWSTTLFSPTPVSMSCSKRKFKEWASAFMAMINDLQFEVIETFQNEDGSRVASRWRIAGRNNGILGTAADQRAISFTGTAVWAVREDGKLSHNWVERSSLELFQQLRDSRSTSGGR